MKKLRILPVPLVLGVGLWLAGCGNDNVNACRAYVAAANQALQECAQDPIYDPESECPASLGEGGPDCSAYYACLGDGWSCVDGDVYVDVEDCTC